MPMIGKGKIDFYDTAKRDTVIKIIEICDGKQKHDIVKSDVHVLWLLLYDNQVVFWRFIVTIKHVKCKYFGGYIFVSCNDICIYVL